MILILIKVLFIYLSVCCLWGRARVREDVMACVSRDPACLTLLEAILFFKGYAALLLYRASQMQWKQPLSNSNANYSTSNSSTATSTATTRFVSLWLQSQASSAFAADIHPGPTIGAAVMFNHGTGIVIEETADLGHECTLLNRQEHPKIVGGYRGRSPQRLLGGWGTAPRSNDEVRLILLTTSSSLWQICPP